MFLPSENEWYKAAYYNPATGLYDEFPMPTGTNVKPTPEAPPGGSDSANYTPGGWPNPDYADAVGHLTDVGAYTLSSSAYGTFDQCGNALQWNESFINSSNGPARGLRGGAFDYVWDHVANFYRDSENPVGEQTNIGFRVATIFTSDALPAVQGNGTFSFSPSYLSTLNGGPLADGSYVLHLQAIDAKGNAATLEVPFTLETSLSPPSLPVLLSANTNNVTNTNTPVIGVNAENGSLVTLLVDDVPTAQATATAGLQFTLGPLADGTYQITATNTDGAGNSATSPALSITISTAPPAAAATAPASFTEDLTPHATVTDSGSGLSAVASSLAAPVMLSQPFRIQLPSATNTKASDVAVPPGAWDYSADSLMDDWPWLEPNRPSDRDSNSSNAEATDFVLGFLTGEIL